MNIIVKPSINNLDSYIENGINTFLLPLKDYSVESINYYSLDEIIKIIDKYKNINIFISINKNIFNSDIEKLKETLLKIDDLKIKGIFYYDLAILNLKKELGLKTDLVWDSTFMVTNYKTCNYYYKKGVKYALIPKSKQKYYLKENEFGTSFILDKLMNGSKILRELTNTKLDYILLKEDMIKHSIFIECIKNIEYYLKNYKTMDDNDYKNWLHKQNELLGRNTNFFYRKTIYKVK